jgi:hypothetical protein
MKARVVILLALAGLLCGRPHLLLAGQGGDWPEPLEGKLRVEVLVWGDNSDSLRMEIKDPRGRVWTWWKPDSITTEIPGSNRSEPLVFRGPVPPQLAFQTDSPMPGTYRLRVEALGACHLSAFVQSRDHERNYNWIETSRHSEDVLLRRGEVACWTVKWRTRPGPDSLMFSLHARRSDER